MSCPSWKFAFFLACTGIALTGLIGCTPHKPAYLNDTGDLSYYLDQATAIEYPDVDVPSLDEVIQSEAPITVVDPDFTSFYDLTLEECVGIALQNAKVLRGYGTPALQQARVLPGQDNLSNGPAAAGTTFNVAIRESEPGFIGTAGQIASPSAVTTNTGLESNQGVEAALAEFDAQFTSNVFWGRTDQPINGDDPTTIEFPDVFNQDRVQWQSEIAKKSANGTQIFFRQVNSYTDGNFQGGPQNAQNQALDSWYQTAFEAEFRQPLLRGRGTFINRMPIVISRINTDQEIANLEAQLQNMVTNVEIRYWELYAAYRALDTARDGFDKALETWQYVNDQYRLGADVNIQEQAQAREQYHFFNGQMLTAYNNLLDAEGKLRFLLGIASTDGRVIRPIDEAVMAPVEFNWVESLAEALSFRPELRQERWEIKKRELALAYAKNSLLPELNVTALYRWLGNGDKYGASDSNAGPFPVPGSGALNDLYDGNFQEFQLGGEFRMPVGFRRELANVKNAQLKVAREIARLEDMELDVTRELAEAFRALAANQQQMQVNFNRWKETVIEVEHFDNVALEGADTRDSQRLNLALNAQRRKAEAELSFYNSLAEYNKVLALIHRRKGTILSFNGVAFTEGLWADKAYDDAREHARRRGASRVVNYGWTRPGVISRGGDAPAGYGTPSGAPIVEEVFGEPVMEEFILDEIPGVPTEAIPLGSVEQGNPNPLAGQSSRVRRDLPVGTGVQQVNFEEPVADAPTASIIRNPVSTEGTPPPRDVLTAPPGREIVPPATHRLPSPTSAEGTGQPIPSSAGSHRGALNWEKFGLTNPPSNDTNVKARIRMSR